MHTRFVAGDEIDGYRIESFLARGGMAEVYRAHDGRLDRRVALKLLAPELTEDESFRLRFMRESKLAASIDHPHIIPIFRAGRFEDVLFLAMRYVDGTDLGGLLDREGPLPLPLVLTLFRQLAAALDTAHAHGLVHRDVKPGNVLIATAAGLRNQHHVYLTDFGLTKRTASLSGLTRPGHFLGTVDYVAPEQITGQPTDARTDVYGLGCVLYEALTGRRPFERDREAAVIYAHLSEPPPSVRKFRPDLPSAVDSVVAAAMAKAPAGRYSTCQGLVADLRRISDNAVPVNPLAIPGGAPASRPPPAATRLTRRRRAAALPPPPAEPAGLGRTRQRPAPVDPPPHARTAERRHEQLATPPSEPPDRRDRRILFLIRVALVVLVVAAVYLMFLHPQG